MPDNKQANDLSTQLLEAADYLDHFLQAGLIGMHTEIDRLWIDLFTGGRYDDAGKLRHDLYQIPVGPICPPDAISLSASDETDEFHRTMNRLGHCMVWSCDPPWVDGAVKQLEFNLGRPIHADKLARLVSAMRKASACFYREISKKTTAGSFIDAHGEFCRTIKDTETYCRDLARMLQPASARCPSRSVPKRPPKHYLQAWRLSIAMPGTQADLAAMLSKELRRKVSQSQVSGWLKSVRVYLKAGGVLPELPASGKEKTRPIDPAVIDLGRRRDGRAKRQRERFED